MFSLGIQNLHIQSLGLRSLRSVSGGLVLLHNNSELCYTSSLSWESLLHPTQGHHRIVSKNKDPKVCGRWTHESQGPFEPPTVCTLIERLSLGSLFIWVKHLCQKQDAITFIVSADICTIKVSYLSAEVYDRAVYVCLMNPYAVVWTSANISTGMSVII